MALAPGVALAQVVAALPAGYGMRDRTEEDRSFLRMLYAHTREDELAQVPWTADEKFAFLGDQFEKQHSHYLQHYPRAQWWVVTFQDAPVGRLYVEQTQHELRVMDVSLLSTHRNRGLGTTLMRTLLNHADQHRLVAALHVEPFNPALRLYERLGFARAETRGVYFFMQRPPASAC